MILNRLMLGCAGLLFVCVGGCRSERIEDLALRLGPVHSAIRSRTATEFELAALWKPRDASLPDDLLSLAPLIVQQIEKNRRDDEASSIDGGRPTVYTALSSVSVNGIDYELAQYAWTYSSDLGAVDTPPGHWTWLLGLLDSDGFALVWSCIGPANLEQRAFIDPFQFYVSKSLELGTKQAYSVPSLGRRYAIEPPLEQWPKLVVAGLFEDGPIPMGPYVYLESRYRKPVTLLCRCSPSQVNEIARSDYYELRPMDDLRAEMDEEAWSNFEEYARFIINGFLENVGPLRWPRDAKAETESLPEAADESVTGSEDIG